MELIGKSDFGDGKSKFAVRKSNSGFGKTDYGVGKSKYGVRKSNFGFQKSDFGVGKSNLGGQSIGATKALGKTKTVITISAKSTSDTRATRSSKPASHGVLPCSVCFDHPSFFKPFT